ncbi:MAG: hypothetical protein ACUVX8_13725 [Candidatus Zipacnadales bacterium]
MPSEDTCRMVVRLIPTLFAVLLIGVPAPAGPLRVGVAKAPITPEQPGQFIAGWGENRVATENHDDIWTRAMAIGDGETTLVIVANDLLGLFWPVTREIATSVQGIPSENIVITCTHVHSAPDVIGLWGPDKTTSGVDPVYLAMVKRRVVRVINAALENMEPAKLRFARAIAPEKTGYNVRKRELIDREISIMQAVTLEDKPICTLVNYACHPEVLRNPSPYITSDFVHYLREAMESHGSGDVLFVNGALGGMVTPEISAPVFEEAERIGHALATVILESMLGEMPEVTESEIRFVRAVLELPMDNPALQQAAEAGLIDRKPSAEGKVETSVMAARIGPAQFASMPGEPLPAVGLAVKERMKADYKFFFSLADDELGYILHADAVDNALYKYEQSMSVNKQAASLLMEVLTPLIEAME